MYMLRNRRLQVFGVPWDAAGQLREIVAALMLLSAGLVAIQWFKSDVPLWALACVPAFAVGLTISTMAGVLLPRDTFHRDKFWDIVVAPSISAFAPSSGLIVSAVIGAIFT
jgi:hypothetical protein